MTIKVGINGLGRIGRMLIRAIIESNNKSIETIENIGTELKMHDVQKAFKNNHGLQCGFCTPGIIM